MARSVPQSTTESVGLETSDAEADPLSGPGKAVAKHGGLPFDRFFLNIGHVGNTSGASISPALLEIEEGLKPGDKLVLCSVGAGMTAAAVAVEW